MTATPSDAEIITMSATASGVPVRVVPNGWRPKEDCLTLAVDELAWLDQFRARLLEEFAGLVADIIVYGFRARGMGDMSLEFKVLVVVSEGDRTTWKQIRELGYGLAAETYAGAMIDVVTKAERAAEQERNRKAFFVEEPRVGISVL